MTITTQRRTKEREDLADRVPSSSVRGRGWLPTIIMIAFFVYFMIPLAWLVIASTKNNADLFSTFGFWFSHHFNLFTNIHAVFAYSNGVFLRWMLNSLIYAVVSAAGASFLATAAGYGFAKYQFPAKVVLLGVVLGAIAVPTTALAIPTYLLFSKIGIVNTPWAIILPSLINPIGVFLMSVYARDAIPDSLIESGRLDGASDIGIFLRIGLRMLVPGLITVFLFSLVHMEQLLPAIGNAEQSEAVPHHSRARPAERNSEQRRRLAGPVLRCSDRIPALDHPAHRRVPPAAAVLAVRPQRRRSEMIGTAPDAVARWERGWLRKITTAAEHRNRPGRRHPGKIAGDGDLDR